MTAQKLYSYLNLESTKTYGVDDPMKLKLYSYLNLESTKTMHTFQVLALCCTVT